MTEGIQKTVVQPSSGWAPFDVAELLRHRELLWFLVWRNIKVRYKQTVLGALWAILQPVAEMLIFTFLFTRIAKIDYEGPSYAIFCFAGLLPWTYFQTAVTNASNSLIQDARLVTKVYFPRVFLPMASTLASLLDYAIAFSVLIVLMIWYGVPAGPELLVILLVMPVAFVAATGFGTLLAALNVEYRDVRYTIPFLMRAGMFLTPVIYPVKALPDRWEWVAFLNPMAGVVEAHRAAVLAEKTIPWGPLGLSVAIAALAFLAGTLYFRRVERSFADII